MNKFHQMTCTALDLDQDQDRHLPGAGPRGIIVPGPGEAPAQPGDLPGGLVDRHHVTGL